MIEQPSNNPESSQEEIFTPERQSLVDRFAIHPLLFVLFSLVAVFLLYQVGGGILTLLITGTATITRENVWTIRWLTMVGQICFILLPTVVFGKLFAVHLSDVFQFRVPGIRESLLALIALFSLQRVFEAYMFFQDQIPLPKLFQDILDPLKKMLEEVIMVLVRADSPVELLVVIMVVAILPAIVEELFFRGLIQKVLERIMSPIVAAILAGTCFGLYHINPFQVVPLIGLGVFFGLLRYRSQTLWLPISAHFFNNLMAVLAFYYGFQNDNLLEAAQTSIEYPAMIFEFVVFTALFFISFVAYLRLTHDISRRTS